MHIAFIDIAASYTAASPLTDALGGTQAAVCHLAQELSAKGAKVSLINQNQVPGSHFGVASFPPTLLDDAAISGYDALVFNGRWTKKLVTKLKQRAPRTTMIGWMHEAAFNDPWILPLPEFDGFVFVSNWQKNINAPLIPAHAKSIVIANGVAPGFETLFKKSTSILSQKSTPPIMVYMGSSKRGLLYLPALLPMIAARFPDMRFEIYSDCNVDNDLTARRALHETLAAISGVTHIGTVSQQELPHRLKHATYFISPNPYPETFCICLAEAMAAGCIPIITARAALPETAAGFATLVPITAADSTDYLKDALDINAFAQGVITTIEKQQALSLLEKETALQKQIAHTHDHYHWAMHAKKWLDYFKHVMW